MKALPVALNAQYKHTNLAVRLPRAASEAETRLDGYARGLL